MKKLFTSLLLLSLGISNAQCITNGSLNSSCTGNGFNTNNNCVQGWQASHGTPTVMGNPSTNTYAWLWSHSNTGEGIFTNYNFIAGRTYQISFDVKTSTNINNPNQTVLNSTANIRAVNGLSSTTNTGIPAPLSGGQQVWQRTIGSNINNWSTITISFTPTQNFSQICFYPLMTANSSRNGNAQVQMEIDNISIIPPVTSVFNFEDTNNNHKTDFCEGETIMLDGTASFGESQYFLDVWRRPIGSTTAFQWQTMIGSNGWTQGSLGILNLTNIFASQNYNFISGYEYQIKVATASPPCVAWVPTTHTFRVLNSNASPAFTYTSSCASDGTITVTVTANDTTAGLAHWWGLMETSVSGSTTDANTIGMVGSIQSGTTTTFTGLSRNRSYYIKHGVYNSCVTWREQRTALPQNVLWSGATTNFQINASNIGNNVSVTAIANPNSVFVNHGWSIYYAPNGSTSGNTLVPGNAGSNASTITFNNNLIVNEWYYIKHGIWNECAPWMETRKAFRIVIQGLLSNGNPIYAVEFESIKDTSPTEGLSNKMNTNTLDILFPNPVEKGGNCRLTTETKNVSKIFLIDLLGKSQEIKFQLEDSQTLNFNLDQSITKGIYMVKVIKNDNSSTTSKLIVE